jgi:hypothetical protein
LMFLLAVGVFYLPAAATKVSAQMSAQKFLLVNKTGVEISTLYITRHSSTEWGDDILGARPPLPAGDTIEITFSPKEKAKLWDLRIEDEKGGSIEWESLDLLATVSITLYYKNGKATAMFDEYSANLNGVWVGYYDDGTKSPYVWNIGQTGSSILITDANGGPTKSKGRFLGNKVIAEDFATQEGTLSADGRKIRWSDGVVWVRE